jgi:hypothetical protein
MTGNTRLTAAAVGRIEDVLLDARKGWLKIWRRSRYVAQLLIAGRAPDDQGSSRD